MNWADLAILGILLVSSLISLKRGFVKEALSLAAWFAAFAVALLFREPLATLFENSIQTHSIRVMVASAVLFVSTLIVCAMVNYLIGEIVKMTGLSGTDRLFGMIFGFVRGVIVVMAILLLVPPILSIDQDSWWRESLLIPPFLSMETWCREITSIIVDFVLGLF